MLAGRYERKIRRRVKAAIRYIPSKPLEIDSPVDEPDREEETGVLTNPDKSKSKSKSEPKKDKEKREKTVHGLPTRIPTLPLPSTLKTKEPSTMSTTTISLQQRKRQETAGLAMMRNFVSNSLNSKAGRMTLGSTHRTSGGGMTNGRGFLGGKVLRSAWGIGTGRVGEGETGWGGASGKRKLGIRGGFQGLLSGCVEGFGLSIGFAGVAGRRSTGRSIVLPTEQDEET
jgi:hypothetical protein